MGSAPARWGGAVNLVSGGGQATSLAGSAGSFGTGTVRGALGRTWASGDVWLAGQAFATEGDFRWFDDAGTRFEATDDRWRVRANNDTRTVGAHARIRLHRGPWTLTLLDSALGREEGVPGFTSAPRSAVRYAASQQVLVAQLDRSGDVPVQLRVHGRGRDERLVDRLGELGVDGLDAVSRTRSLGADVGVSLLAAPTARVDLRAGARTDHFGAPADLRDRQVLSARAGLAWWVVPDVFELNPGGSVTGLWNDAGRDGALLPRLGAQVRPADGWRLRGQVARTFRPPDPTELYGNSGVLVGRPDLRPERGWTADLGIRRSQDRWAVDVGLFRSDAVDLIAWIQNAQQVAIATNLGRTRVMGLEGALHLLPWPWLESQTNLTLQRSRNLSDLPAYDGRPLPRQPGFALDQRTSLTSGRWRVGHVLAWTGAMTTDQAGLFRQAPRALQTVFARVDLRGGLAMELDVLNAAGTRIQQTPANAFDPDGPRSPTALADFVGYPLPGRTVLWSLRFDEVR